jgi:hypothetical protein
METVSETNIAAVAGSVPRSASEARCSGEHVVDTELLKERN